MLGSFIAFFGDEGGRAAGVLPGLVAMCAQPPCGEYFVLAERESIMTPGCYNRSDFLRDRPPAPTTLAPLRASGGQGVSDIVLRVCKKGGVRKSSLFICEYHWVGGAGRWVCHSPVTMVDWVMFIIQWRTCTPPLPTPCFLDKHFQGGADLTQLSAVAIG